MSTITELAEAVDKAAIELNRSLDALLTGVDEEIATKDAEIARLEAHIAEHCPDVPVEPPEPPLPSAFGTLTLFDVPGNKALDVMTGGETYPIAGQPVSVVADTVAPALSCKFIFNGSPVRTESTKPWALYGDSGGKLTGGSWNVGPHTLVVEYYAASNGTGDKLGTDTVAFTVTEAATEPPIEPPIEPPPGTTITTGAELSAALAAAQGGETFVLADGDFGALVLNRAFPSTVTIRAQHRGKAVFDSVNGNGAYFTLDGVRVENETRFSNPGHHYAVLNSDLGTDMTPSMDSTGCYQIRTHHVTIANNDINGAKYALILNEVDDFLVEENYIHGARIDLMRVGCGHRGKIFNNTIMDAQAVSGDHPDAMQFFGYSDMSPGDMHIRGNYIWDNRATGTTYMQGIFIKDAEFHNFLVEENIVCVESPNSIYFLSSRGNPSNIVIRNNTVRSWKNGGGGGMIRVLGNSNSTVTVDNVKCHGNVCRKWEDARATQPFTKENFVHSDDAASPVHWSKLWQGEPSTWQGSLPVPGGPIDFGTPYGAQVRLQELLAGD